MSVTDGHKQTDRQTTLVFSAVPPKTIAKYIHVRAVFVCAKIRLGNGICYTLLVYASY